MGSKMEEIRQLQQRLFEAQQGKAVSRLTDANVVELVQLLQERALVTLHLSGQGYLLQCTIRFVLPVSVLHTFIR